MRSYWPRSDTSAVRSWWPTLPFKNTSRFHRFPTCVGRFWPAPPEDFRWRFSIARSRRARSAWLHRWPPFSVLSLPATFGVLTQGRPGALKLSGFALALIAIWLISLPEQGRGPKGLLLAVLSGFGFGLFYIFMEQAGSGSALWLSNHVTLCGFATQRAQSPSGAGNSHLLSVP